MNRLLSLKTELDKPTYSGLLGASAALDALHAVTKQRDSNFTITITTLSREFGTIVADALMYKFETAAANSTALTRILPLMKPSEDGVNASDAEFQAMITSLANNAPFTNIEAESIKSLGSESYAPYLWATLQDVIDARHL